MKRLLSPANRHVLGTFARGRVLLAFDFDGTLAPLVAHADDANMRPSTAKLFDAVAYRYPCVIVTGRRTRDIKERLGQAPVAAVVGNHGADAAANRGGLRHIIAAARRVLTPIANAQRGAWIENKTYSLSVHYTMNDRTAEFLTAIRTAVGRLPHAGIVPGKKVINVVVEGAPDKGRAVEQLRRSLQCERVLFVGDDETDERVFRAMPESVLLGVRVGRAAHSKAEFYLDTQSDIDELLRHLIALRDDKATPSPDRADRIGALGEALEFMRVLWALDHAMHRRSKSMHKKIGITGEQRLALRLAVHAPGVSAGDLAAMLHIHPSTLTGVLDRLVRKKLLIARADNADRRRLLIHATRAGERLLDDRQTTIEDAVELILKTTSDADAAITRSVIERIVRTLTA